MKKQSLLMIFGCVLIGLSTPIMAFEDGDWQYWPRITISGRLGPKIVVKMDEEFRVGDSVQDLYFHRSDFSVSYSPEKWLSLNVSYWQSAKQGNESWTPEKRPHFNLTVKQLFGGFQVADRNRLERRFVGTAAPVWRYRNQLAIKAPWKWTHYQLQPAFAGEVFYDFKNDNWHRQRAFVILDSRLSRHVGINWYYLAEYNRKGEAWLITNVFGTKLNLSF